MKILPFSVLVFVVAGLACAAVAEDEDADLNTLSPVVQKTARELIGNAKVDEVEPTFENGKHAYEVEFKRNGNDMAVVISPEGKLIQTETRMPVAAAPEKIRNAALKAFPDGKITRVRAVEIDKVVHFEVFVQAGGKSHTVNLDKDGKILKSAH